MTLTKNIIAHSQISSKILFIIKNSIWKRIVETHRCKLKLHRQFVARLVCPRTSNASTVWEKAPQLSQSRRTLTRQDKSRHVKWKCEKRTTLPNFGDSPFVLRRVCGPTASCIYGCEFSLRCLHGSRWRCAASTNLSSSRGREGYALPSSIGRTHVRTS